MTDHSNACAWKLYLTDAHDEDKRAGILKATPQNIMKDRKEKAFARNDSHDAEKLKSNNNSMMRSSTTSHYFSAPILDLRGQ